VVIDTGPKKSDERKRSSEWMEKFVLKKIDRAGVVRDDAMTILSPKYKAGGATVSNQTIGFRF
jgi:hypothetical protein